MLTDTDLRRARNDGALRFSGWGLTSIPPEIFAVGNLERLYLVENSLSTLPSEIQHLKNLVELDLQGNRLTSLPQQIGELSKLEQLYLSGNTLMALPESIGQLVSLRSLTVSGNVLRSLPASIGQLKNLEELDIRNNAISELPQEIGGLTRLRRLYASGNRINELPREIGRLTRLDKLSVDNNQLTALPAELAPLLKRALVLNVDGNPLVTPLPELISRGPAALSTYLRSIEEAVPQYEAKVMVVGEGNVGKSSLVRSVLGEPFDTTLRTTHGLQVRQLSLPHPHLGLDMTVRLWDFGGQELYRITHQFFFSRRALYLVVWNARNGHEQDEVEDWLRRILIRVGREARAVLVATHCDERHPDIGYPQLEVAFPGVLAGAAEIDNASGTGIADLKELLAVEAAGLPIMGRLLSPRWTAARDAVLTSHEPQISYEQFAEICAEHGLDTQECRAFAELLHDLGQVVFYGDDDGLRDVVVLNPDWLTRAISYVLGHEPTRAANGILDHSHLPHIWGDGALDESYEPRYYPYFLRLMEKFDVCYRLEGNDRTSLIAQLVPYRRPVLPWHQGTPLMPDIRSATIVCRLTNEAPGLISWLTVRHHTDSVGLHWRHGVFLRHATHAYESEALIEWFPNDRQLVLQVRAPSPDMYLHVLCDSLEHLLTRRWPGLEYRMTVPCPTPSCRGEFPLSGLIRRRGRASTQNCLQCDSDHDITALLTGFVASDFNLQTEFDRLHDRIQGLSVNISRVQGDVASIAGLATESADSLRLMLKAITAEVADCPRLFSLTPRPSRRPLPGAIAKDTFRLTLWCEHSGDWHPWKAASYTITVPKDWLTKVAPYANLVFKALRLVVPLSSAIAGVIPPDTKVKEIDRALTVMKGIVDQLPTSLDLRNDQITERGSLPTLNIAEGQGLRALRQLLFERDKARAFGGLRRFQAPSGEYIWICPEHVAHYDPGLPIIPST